MRMTTRDYSCSRKGCGHAWGGHAHYRAGSECSAAGCTCTAYRPPRRTVRYWLARLGMAAAVIGFAIFIGFGAAQLFVQGPVRVRLDALPAVSSVTNSPQIFCRLGWHRAWDRDHDRIICRRNHRAAAPADAS